ncbi:MAG: hypothetical protein AB7G21_13435 [Dehalococcoidia bacterium]
MTSIMFRPDPPGPRVGTHPMLRARVAVRRTLDEAEQIAAMLSEHGLDALVETDAVDLALPGSSVLPGVLGTPGGMFAYPVTVPFAEREQARSVVRASAARLRPMDTGTLIPGLVLGLAIAALVALGRLATT